MAVNVPANPTVRASARRGFTLIEAALSVGIVAFVLTGALSALAATARSAKLQADRRFGQTLAQSLMAEIVLTRYEEPDADKTFGPEAGELAATGRSAFDDVDDYANYLDSPPRDKAGNALANAAGWSRRVEVARVASGAPDGPAAGAETGLKRVRVIVTAPDGKQTILAALRSAYGSPDIKLSVRTEYLAGVSIAVQVGPDPAGLAQGLAAVQNRPVIAINP